MRVLIITGSRADWGPLSFVANELKARTGMQVAVAATGQHLQGHEKGTPLRLHGWDSVVATFFENNKREDTPFGVVNEFAWTAVAAAQLMTKQMIPDLVVVLGDRFEVLSAVIACSIIQIPVAHIAGGDVTEGSLDDGFRNAITMLSKFHFTTNSASMSRVERMTDDLDADFVWNTGSPSVDRVMAVPPLSRAAFYDWLKFDNGRPLIVFNFQPPTRSESPMAELEVALDAIGRNHAKANFLAVGCNVDAGGFAMNERIRCFFTGPTARFIQNMAPNDYIAALRVCGCLVGNSSSGIYEAPIIGCPVVNIGQRQTGRPMPTCVMTVEPKLDAISAAIDHQMIVDRYEPQYTFGKGEAAKLIADIICRIDPRYLKRGLYAVRS